MERIETSSQALEHNGCSLHYWLVGDKMRPLVTFIHGAAIDHHVFDPQIVAATSFFRVLLWDLRGHGQSKPAAKPFSVRVAVEDLVAILDHLGYAQTALIGLSFGSTIAQEFLRLFPQRATALVSTGAPCNTIRLTKFTYLILLTFKVLIHYAPIEVLRRLFSCYASEGLEAKSYVYQAFLQFSEKDHRHIMEAFIEIFQLPASEATYRITHPLLLLQGEYDIIWNRWLIPHWIKRDNKCRHVVIPKAGHLANWDDINYFNHALIDFLVSSITTEKEDSHDRATLSDFQCI